MIDNSSGDDLPQRDNDDDGAEERAEEDEAEKCGYVWGEEEEKDIEQDKLLLAEELAPIAGKGVDDTNIDDSENCS